MKLFAQCDRDGAVAQAGQAAGGVWVLPPGWIEVEIVGSDLQLCPACAALWTQAVSDLVAQQFAPAIPQPVTVMLSGPVPIPAPAA